MKWWQRILVSTREMEREEAEERAEAEGAESIATCRERSRVCVVGRITSVTYYPEEPLRLEASVFDGSGRLRVVWLGRRQIAGISPGRMLRVQGRVGRVEGELTVVNPRYELLLG